MTITCCLKSDDRKQDISLRHSEAEGAGQPLKRKAAHPSCLQSRAPWPLVPWKGGRSSGVDGWLGPLLSFAQSDYQFEIQMNSSFLPAERDCPAVAPALRVAPAWQKSREEPDPLSTKEKVLWAQREAPDTGGSGRHGWVQGGGGWAPGVHTSFPTEPRPVLGRVN